MVFDHLLKDGEGLITYQSQPQTFYLRKSGWVGFSDHRNTFSKVKEHIHSIAQNLMDKT